MDCPGFCILHYGVYDSAVAMPKAAMSRTRCVRRFELELFTEDLPGVTYIDGTAYPLQKGLFICGKPGQMRWSRLPLRCHYLHLGTEDETLTALLQRLPDGCILSNAGAAERLFRELAAAPEPARPEDALLMGSTAAGLIALLCQATRQELRTEKLVSRSHRTSLQETEKYILDHLSEDLSLDALAARAGFSPSHFHRVFTAWFGKPPHEFVLDRRLEAARAALQADRCSLSDLAASCGFSSQSHFSARFKKATGQTPGEYRRAMLSRLEV